MSFTTIDNILSPQMLTYAASGGALSYAGYVAAKDLYHLGFAGVATAGQAVSNDAWYKEKRLEHWESATNNWQRDIAVVTTASLAGYYGFRYVAPMLGEISDLYDTVLASLNAVNQAGIPQRIESMAGSIDKLQAAVENATADTAATLSKVNTMANTVLDNVNMTSISQDIGDMQNSIHMAAKQGSDVANSLGKIPGILGNVNSITETVNAIVSSIQVPYLFSK